MLKSIGWTGVDKDGNALPGWRSGSSWNRGYYGPKKVYRSEASAKRHTLGDSRVARIVEVFIKDE